MEERLPVAFIMEEFRIIYSNEQGKCFSCESIIHTGRYFSNIVCAASMLKSRPASPGENWPPKAVLEVRYRKEGRSVYADFIYYQCMA